MNAACYDANVLLMVFDNRWTSMTGHQPTPSTEESIDGIPQRNVDIAKLLKSMGTKWVRKVNPFEPRKVERAVIQALKQSGFKAIVVEGECGLQSAKRNRRLSLKPEVTYQINAEKCKMCDVCFVDFGCPAIVMQKDDDDSDIYVIDRGLCDQCGACSSVCISDAIEAHPVGKD
jgi:indolepyruvate ferredoxin oxidoreductase alpha subunit